MHRELLPNEAVTNTRPYLIFFGYLTTCFLVAAYIIRRLVKSSIVLQKSRTATSPPRHQVWLFSVLAVGSLLTTWTHMFRFFNLSYQTWLTGQSYYALEPQRKHWGLWLKETTLFREAWETVIIGHARYWWSHQIFFFALGLGLYLEQRGIRRGIKYTWAFMLLGQIVAISFATNLFFLTLLLSPRTSPPSASRGSRWPWVGPWLLNLISIFATAYPAMLLADEQYWHHPTAFMPILLAPHVALLILPCARAIGPAKYLSEDEQFTDKAYIYMWALVVGNAGAMLIWTTATAYSHSGIQGLWQALHEHPAVSSVGYDVIFCWISWMCWYHIQEQKVVSSSNTVSKVADGKEAHTVCSTAAGDQEHDGGVRRR